jgi:bifunctional UDP-N-acetylglucosamine pyrophosphorylase / glucosamine-1-phosphate N-acetyltransferase
MTDTTQDSRLTAEDWSVALVVLAAGAGTRMRSKLPKPLHPLAGLPMISHVLRAGAGASPISTTIVTSPLAADIARQIPSGQTVHVVVQETPRGTGDAVLKALDSIDGVSHLLILFADHPVLTKETVADLVDGARRNGALVTVLTCLVLEAKGYGRIERDTAGRAVRIVEQKDDSAEQRAGETEINSGMMVIDAGWAKEALPNIEPSEATGEYYLTELVAAAVADFDEKNGPWPVATVLAPAEVALGINDRMQLAEAGAVLRDRIRKRHMLSGVTIQEPQTVVIDEDVEIGQDTTILPYSMILGRTVIGDDCTIGPSTVISNSQLARRVNVQSSTVTDSSIAEESDVGPYSHLRRGAEIGPRVHVGNFGEIKNSVIGESAKIGHFSYIGDAHVGAGTNIGAGTVTCNFDGVEKHHTEIGAKVFVGSDSMLIAPVTIGDRATIGAGSVVTRDVDAGATVVGVPARQIKRSATRTDSAADDKGE